MQTKTDWRGFRSRILLVTFFFLMACNVAGAAPQAAGQTNGQVKFWVVVFIVWLALFAIGMTVGHVIGTAWSINYQGPKSDPDWLKYVANKAVISATDWNRQRGAKGELISLTAVCSYRFTYGIHAWVYNSKIRDKPRRESAAVDEIDFRPHRNGLTPKQLIAGLGGFGGALGAFVVPASAYAGTTTTNAVSNYAALISNVAGGNKIGLIVLGLFGFAIGYFTGFKWGYQYQPESNGGRLESLLEEESFWQQVAELKKPKAWTFTVRDNIILAKREGQTSYANVLRLGPTVSQISTAITGTGLGSWGLLGGLGPYLAGAPPVELLDDLAEAGEQDLANRLAAQQGSNLGGWSIGFPL
jgi:hypothetical protein